MPFEMFKKHRIYSANADPRPIVKIYKTQRKFGFNIAAYWALEKPPAVHMFFDTERRAVGIRKAEVKAQDAFKVAEGSSNFGHERFFDALELDLEPYENVTNCLAKMEGDMLVFVIPPPPETPELPPELQGGREPVPTDEP